MSLVWKRSFDIMRIKKPRSDAKLLSSALIHFFLSLATRPISHNVGWSVGSTLLFLRFWAIQRQKSSDMSVSWILMPLPKSSLPLPISLLPLPNRPRQELQCMYGLVSGERRKEWKTLPSVINRCSLSLGIPTNRRENPWGFGNTCFATPSRSTFNAHIPFPTVTIAPRHYFHHHCPYQEISGARSLTVIWTWKKWNMTSSEWKERYIKGESKQVQVMTERELR